MYPKPLPASEVLTQRLTTPPTPLPQTAGDITHHNVTELFRTLAAWGPSSATQGDPQEAPPGNANGTGEPGRRGTQLLPLEMGGRLGWPSGHTIWGAWGPAH